MNASDNLRKVRISRRFADYLTGKQCFHERDDDPELHYLIYKILGGRRYYDESYLPALTARECDLLLGCAEDLYDAARDDAGWLPSARADMNAAAALIRKLREP